MLRRDQNRSGRQLVLGRSAILDLQNGQGRVIVDGKLIAQDYAIIQGGNIAVRQAQITTSEPVRYNDIHLIDGWQPAANYSCRVMPR